MNVFFGFQLPVDLKEYLKEQAEKNRTSMGHYIVTLILDDMRKDDSNNGNRKVETVAD